MFQQTNAKRNKRGLGRQIRYHTRPLNLGRVRSNQSVIPQSPPSMSMTMPRIPLISIPVQDQQQTGARNLQARARGMETPDTQSMTSMTTQRSTLIHTPVLVLPQQRVLRVPRRGKTRRATAAIRHWIPLGWRRQIRTHP